MANTAVFGIYQDRPAVEHAIATLKAASFRNTDISVLFPDNVGTKDLAHEKSSKAPEGAASGAGSGAVIGGALGWLVGIGALAIPPCDWHDDCDSHPTGTGCKPRKDMKISASHRRAIQPTTP